MGEKQDPAKSGSELSPHRHSWWRILLLGFGMYFIGLFLLIVTGNPNLFPTVVLIGSFMVPVTFVAFFYERRYLSTVGMPSTALSFIYGGILGTFAASILEPIFIHHLDFQTAFVVGLIEEFTKILGVLVIARRHFFREDRIPCRPARCREFVLLRQAWDSPPSRASGTPLPRS